jgi:hypothetical protein
LRTIRITVDAVTPSLGVSVAIVTIIARFAARSSDAWPPPGRRGCVPRLPAEATGKGHRCRRANVIRVARYSKVETVTLTLVSLGHNETQRSRPRPLGRP